MHDDRYPSWAPRWLSGTAPLSRAGTRRYGAREVPVVSGADVVENVEQVLPGDYSAGRRSTMTCTWIAPISARSRIASFTRGSSLV